MPCRQLPLLATLLSLLASPCVRGEAACEDWCTELCTALNGDVRAECGGCPDDPRWRCRPGQPGLPERAAQFAPAVDAAERLFELAPWLRGPVEGLLVRALGALWARGPVIPGHEVETCEPVEFGACELEVFEHAAINRTWLLGHTQPIIIRGATTEWKAHELWGLDSMVERYGEATFHLDNRAGAVSLAKLLRRSGKYNMGHVVQRSDCYKETYRPYSPFLETVAADYRVPEYLQPMKTFQMGIGNGGGVGVPPEEHPGAWFVAVKGRKRWSLHPPSRGNEPPSLMRNQPGCLVTTRSKSGLLCDQVEGDMIWVPDFWWHETCGMDAYSVGIGGITYESVSAPSAPCRAADEYRVDELPYCKTNKCPTL